MSFWKKKETEKNNRKKIKWKNELFSKKRKRIVSEWERERERERE